jgi:soluble lytic murein transglycosylase
MNRIRAATFILMFMMSSVAHAAVTEDALLRTIGSGQWEAAYRMSQHGGDPFVRTLATWYYLVRSTEIAPYEMYERFVKQHPDWPQQSLLRGRMEIAFLNSDPAPLDIAKWFKTYPPTSARAQLLYGDATGSVSKQDVQTYWVEGNFSAREEEYLLTRYRSVLSPVSHEQRIDRLLWEGNISAAERMLPYVSGDIQKLSRARLALRANRPDAARLMNAVPARLMQNAGLIYERVRFRVKRSDYAGVKELLLSAPQKLPQAHRWWDYQARVIRDAIEAREYGVAKRLLDKHSQIAPVQRVDAEWMRGWLYYAFLKQPAIAITPFENIYETAQLPISRSRGAYWAGRALEDSGKKTEAIAWFQKAAMFPTTFFGQLAHQRIKPNTPLPLPRVIPPAEGELAQFVATTPLAAQLKKFATKGHAELLAPIVTSAVIRATAPEYGARMAALAHSVGESALAINLAKEVQIKGIYIAELFPVVQTPKNLAIDPAFALAIARQESRFDRTARSPADARGLMQLLPTTARLVAKSHGMPFDLASLYQPHYNMTLGSHYMKGVLERFRGARILAIAGYNAGPSRSDQWLDRFGSLTQDFKRNIQWTEMIPFGETRNYVQRVLENYHVYRHILSGGKAILQAEQALILQ